MKNKTQETQWLFILLVFKWSMFSVKIRTAFSLSLIYFETISILSLRHFLINLKFLVAIAPFNNVSDDVSI